MLKLTGSAARCLGLILFSIIISLGDSSVGAQGTFKGANLSCCRIQETEGPVGGWGPTKTWAPMENKMLRGEVAQWEDWHDLGTLILQAANDQTWGLYSLSARAFITSLRLQRGLAIAHYHLGYTIQLLRENAGKHWIWMAHNSFTLASILQPTESTFEGLAWFHIQNENAEGAVVAYTRGLRQLCKPKTGTTISCQTSTAFIFRWWDAIQQSCSYGLYEEGLDIAWSTLREQLSQEPGNLGLHMAQAMRMPLSDILRLRVAKSQILQLESTFQKQGIRPFQRFPRSEWFPAGLYSPPKRIRIGYLSFNFSPTRSLNGLSSGMFKRHDRRKFEVLCFAIYGHHGRDSNDEKMRVEKEADEFVNLFVPSPTGERPSDQEMASIINTKEIDILVDLIGLIQQNRHGIMVLRPATVQVNMIYAATTGGDHIDFFVSDKVASPPDLVSDVYTERMMLLPGSHFVNNQAELLPRTWPVPTREEFSLPDKFLVGGFNAFFKITPLLFEAWMTVLKQNLNAVLVLVKYQYFDSAQTNLRMAARNHSVNHQRILFADKTKSLLDHIRRASTMSVYLDTRIYNAHTLAVDVLWAGTPIVTFPETSLASRVSSSLLSAAGLPITIAKSYQDYVDIVHALVTGQYKSGRWNQELRTRFSDLRHTSEIFDMDVFMGRYQRALLMAFDTKLVSMERGKTSHLMIS